MAVHIEFRVVVTEMADGWQIKVDDGSAYADVIAPDLEVGLRMVVPYLAAVASPSPFDQLVKALGHSAPDGPKDMG